VTERPYVLLSCAVSVDGCLDAPGPQRLILSGEADLDRVDDERAQADAIMVGAGTIRRDDPRLLIRSPERRAARIAAGLPEHPAGVTLTASGDLDPGARFFAAPPAALRLVYCPAPLSSSLRIKLNGLAEVIAIPPPAGLAAILTDLARRGVGRLLVEGGARLSRQFLADGLVDELELAVAPFFVGSATAPRFAGPAVYPHDPGNPMRLAEVRRLDEVVLLRYLLGGDGGGAADAEGTPGQARGEGSGATGEPPLEEPGEPGRDAEATMADREWLRRAIELSRRCPPSRTAFAVGALVVADDGEVLATGYSREGSPLDHAEEVALAKLDPADPRLAGATLYSSLEPCRFRASRPQPCAELIIEAGLRRVVIAWLEPPLFVAGGGAGLLRDAGITVVELPDLAAEARAVNADVLGD
jgi:riboflavin-specific deaminase-like protein